MFNSRSTALLAQVLNPRSRYANAAGGGAGGGEGGPPQGPADNVIHHFFEPTERPWQNPMGPGQAANENTAPDAPVEHIYKDPMENWEPKYPEGYDPAPHGGEDFHIKPAFDEGGWAKSPPEAPWTIAAAPVIAKAVEGGWNSVQPPWMGNDPGTVGAETQTNLPPEQGYSGAETQTALDPMQTPPDISGDWGGGGGMDFGGGFDVGNTWGGGNGYDPGNSGGGYGGGDFGFDPGSIDQILEYLGIGGGAGNPGGLLGSGPPVEMN